MGENLVVISKAEYDELQDINTRVDVLQELINNGHILQLDLVFDILGIFH